MSLRLAPFGQERKFSSKLGAEKFLISKTNTINNSLTNILYMDMAYGIICMKIQTDFFIKLELGQHVAR
ncbi:hypothetical protein LguiA_033632 [Lonicera macranthoides]